METLTLNQSPNLTVESDQNNNIELIKNEKYSLRQRGQRSRKVKEDVTPKGKPEKKTAKEKPKQKAAPLSKYRRKTANARERTRMREINTAFESLRKSVPVVVAGAAQSQTANEKLTKITTLRMAMKYIKILNDILTNKTAASEDLLSSLMDTDPSSRIKEEPEQHQYEPLAFHPQSSTKSSVKSSKSHSTNINNSILIQNNHDYCKGLIVNDIKPTKSVKITSKKATKTIVKQKRESKKPAQRVLKKQNVQPSAVYLDDFCNKNNAILHRNIKFDTSLSPPMDDSPAELGLILESDGESLQLSEPCFSPLELGLLLESDGESLHLSEPCLSPLNHLDALNSFNDLLNTGFSEPTLDMYWS